MKNITENFMKNMMKHINTRNGFLTIAGVILVVGGLLGGVFGSYRATASLNGQVMDATALAEEIDNLIDTKLELSSDISSLQNEKEETTKLIETKESVESEIEEVEAKLEDIQGTLDEELEEGRKKIDEELAKLNSEIDSKKSEIQNLSSEIESKEDELSTLTGKIKETGETPITLPAGQFTVGADLPSGRYKVTASGRGSNFVVYTPTGTLAVNTIIGSSGLGVDEYVVNLETGSTIDARASFKYTPVQ